MHDDFDRPPSDSPQKAHFPAVSIFAGITWIILGFLVMFLQGVSLIPLLDGISSGDIRELATAYFARRACAGIFLFVFGLAFMLVGVVQTASGKARNALSNGVCSIFFGLVELGIALFAMIMGVGNQGSAQFEIIVIGAVINALVGIGFIFAGVLAILGAKRLGGLAESEKSAEAKKKRGGIAAALAFGISGIILAWIRKRGIRLLVRSYHARRL